MANDPKDKSPDKVTDAGSVELEENELDNVTGGAIFLKLGDIKGEAINADKSHNKWIDVLSTDFGSDGGTKQGSPPPRKRR